MQVIKIHNWIKTVLMIAVLTQLPSCAIQKNAASEKLNKGFTILGFGDSITEGGPDFFLIYFRWIQC
jgi:hypothetical protein